MRRTVRHVGHQSTRAPARTFTGVVRVDPFNVSIVQFGPKISSWWGMEHSSIVLHAVAAAASAHERCVLIEAGAHQGSLAILAARAGCDVVFAFEANEAHCKRMAANVQANAASDPRVTRAVRIVPGLLGETPAARRIDTHVDASWAPVSLLKMDIDGADAFAMRGASELFLRRTVHFVNIEFSPSKQRRLTGNGPAASYLRLLHGYGFELYLFSCVPNARAEARMAMALSGGRCLTYGNYVRKEPRNPYFENSNATAFARCVFQRDGGWGADEPCATLLRQQHIRPKAFDHFANVVHEVDLVGRLAALPSAIDK